MAALQTRSFFSTFSLPWLTRPTFAPALSVSQTPFNPALPILQPLLDLLPSIVLAVPKSKVSHSRKSMRSANKGLKDKQNIVNCPACGGVKLAHHACRSCYDAIIAKSRQEANKSSTKHRLIPSRLHKESPS